MKLLGREPVLFMLLAESLVYGITEFGVVLTSGQQTAILGFTAALLSIITRQSVNPVRQ